MREKIVMLMVVLTSACSVYGGGGGGGGGGSASAGSAGDDEEIWRRFKVIGATHELMNPAVDATVTVMPSPDASPLDLMPGDIATVAIPFQAAGGNVVAAGISFGPGQPVQVVPMPDMLGAGDGQMQLQFEVPDSVCDNLSAICHQVECYEFAVTDIGKVSAADINSIAVACGDCDEPSCQMFLDMCMEDPCAGQVAPECAGDTPYCCTISDGGQCLVGPHCDSDPCFTYDEVPCAP